VSAQEYITSPCLLHSRCPGDALPSKELHTLAWRDLQDLSLHHRQLTQAVMAEALVREKMSSATAS